MVEQERERDKREKRMDKRNGYTEKGGRTSREGRMVEV